MIYILKYINPLSRIFFPCDISYDRFLWTCMGFTIKYGGLEIQFMGCGIVYVFRGSHPASQGCHKPKLCKINFSLTDLKKWKLQKGTSFLIMVVWLPDLTDWGKYAEGHLEVLGWNPAHSHHSCSGAVPWSRLYLILNRQVNVRIRTLASVYTTKNCIKHRVWLAPRAVATRAWLTALWATTRTDFPSWAKILFQQLLARSQSSLTG